MRGLKLWGAATAALFLLPAVALAAAPTLLSVGHDSGHPKATWSLPLGMDSATAEVATSADADSAGAFKKVEVREGLQPAQTSWRSGAVVDPGTYFVHVGATPTGSPGSPVEWSNVLKLNVRKARMYKGTTSQGGQISFTFAGLGTRVAQLSFIIRANCQGGSARNKTKFRRPLKVRRKVRRFSARVPFSSPIDRGFFAVGGRFTGQGRAKGTLRFKAFRSPIGSCDSGRVSWQARGRG